MGIRTGVGALFALAIIAAAAAPVGPSGTAQAEPIAVQVDSAPAVTVRAVVPDSLYALTRSSVAVVRLAPAESLRASTRTCDSVAVAAGQWRFDAGRTRPRTRPTSLRLTNAALIDSTRAPSRFRQRARDAGERPSRSPSPASDPARSASLVRTLCSLTRT